MRDPILCRLGFHRWTANDERPVFMRWCARCYADEFPSWSDHPWQRWTAALQLLISVVVRVAVLVAAAIVLALIYVEVTR